MKHHEFEEQTNGGKDIKTLFEGYVFKKTKHEYEFQEVCSDLQAIYGKAIWTLPFKEGVTEFKIRKAHEIAQRKGVKNFAYLYGIIKKLPY